MADAEGDAATGQRDKKLIDVARLVGYESDAAFSKAFKRVVGAHTGEYIKRGSEGRAPAGMAEAFEVEDSDFGGGSGHHGSVFFQ